jgi:hypothetical protein
VAVALSICVVAAAVDRVVEDWQHQTLGARGVPVGWSELPLLERLLVKRGFLEIVEDEGRRALHVRTETDQHTIIRRRIRADLRVMPALTWQWKVTRFPVGADLRERARSDSPAVLAIAWSSPPRVVAYAWDVTAPAGSRFSNPKQARVNYIVVRSGTAAGGHWVRELRDVVDDYRIVFGESPSSNPEEIELSVDSNDTRSVSDMLLGPIAFRPRELTSGRADRSE